MNLLLEGNTSKEEETFHFGRRIIKRLPKGTNLIIIKGQLGAGKTVLVKGMAKELKIHDNIVSPTYGYKKQYNGMVHYDLFLMNKLSSKGLEALVSEELEDNIVIVEWGEKLSKIKNSIVVTISVTSSVGRKIKVEQR